MQIYPVQTRSQWKEFVHFPYQLHRGNQNWIPPLIVEQKKIFDPERNSMLKHCDHQLFLLKDNSQVIGRIAAFIDRSANEHWQDSIGLFGSYECIQDENASQLLLKTAYTWLQKKKVAKMRGPWSFVSQDWGFIVEGYDVPPIVMSSYNPEYYNQQVEAFGLRKVKDLLVYNCDLAKGYAMPQRFFSHLEKIASRYQVTVRPIQIKNMVEDVKKIVRLVNSSTSRNWGVTPVSDDEAQEIAADLKMIVHPEAVLIAEIDGEPIGYVIGLPDVNCLLKNLKGRLWPFGIFKLLFGIKKINRYRIWALGIAPEYQRKGIPGLLFLRLNQALSPRKPYIEANYILEDNHIMNNTMHQLKFDLVKKYRIYEKPIEGNSNESD
ncbi:GNAT family N-acetyltransferase [candidate division KSB1 bacterium]|nr:GNAT family N-acetyltransferase [candidate division KSB1 bacterium]